MMNTRRDESVAPLLLVRVRLMLQSFTFARAKSRSQGACAIPRQSAHMRAPELVSQFRVLDLGKWVSACSHRLNGAQPP